MRTILSVAAIAVCAVALAACGSSSTGPNYPHVAGTYTATITYVLNNADIDSTAVVPGTITLTDPDRTGLFDGPWKLTGSGADTATGVVVGQISASGNTFTWLGFGDTNAPPLVVLQVLEALYPTCHYANALTVAQPATGAITGTALNVSGTFSGFKCGADSAASTLSATVVGTNTTGPT